MLYKLVSTNLSHLGTMGADTPENFSILSEDINKLKRLAQADYGEDLAWEETESDFGTGFTTGDLNYVMYDITPQEVI